MMNDRRLQLFAKLFAASLTVSVSTLAQARESARCEMNGVVLACGPKSAPPAAIARALGSAFTRDLLGAPSLTLAFRTIADRETFRRSLEHNRRRAEHYGRSELARFRRGEINAAQYDTVRRTLSAATVGYRAGVEAYRNTYWTDPDWEWGYDD